MGKLIPFRPKGQTITLSIITDDHIRVGATDGDEPIAVVIRDHASVCMSVATTRMLILGLQAALKEHGSQ